MVWGVPVPVYRPRRPDAKARTVQPRRGGQEPDRAAPGAFGPVHPGRGIPRQGSCGTAARGRASVALSAAAGDRRVCSLGARCADGGAGTR